MNACPESEPRVAVVIPCYRVAEHVLDVIRAIGPEVSDIIVVDDACPDGSGRHVLAHCMDDRVVVLFHGENQGVGGAVMTGYRHALALGAAVMVKLDGDGQMDPALIPVFVRPILAGEADYTKGNRFHNIEDVRAMPVARLIGNAALSFFTKLSSGYWNLFDPTNGYTAINATVAAHLPLDKIARRYFFESDMLFRLGVMRACVIDIPMTAVYGAERSNLSILRVFLPFLASNLGNLGKRIFYNYFLRDFSIASLQLLFGLLFVAFGGTFGLLAWMENSAVGKFASTGTVMLAALPVILGVQFLLSFIAFDVAATPSRPVQGLLAGRGRRAAALAGGSAVPVEAQAVRDQRAEAGQAE
jgi:dolichol-phosphate mannosyltransferase